MLALAAFILVGFVMTTLGVALLCLGEVPFIGGKRIPALRSRLIGVVLVAFVPLALGARQASIYLFGPDAVDAQAVTWTLFGLCWFVVFAILFRVMAPKRAPRQPVKATAKKNPFPEAKLDILDEIVEEAKPAAKKATPPKKPADKKASKPPAEDENPFDFS
jgi:hypothetical protein